MEWTLIAVLFEKKNLSQQKMFGWFSYNEENSTSGWAKSTFLVLAGSAMLFGAIGYALKPVSEIVDELHDSDDSSE